MLNDLKIVNVNLKVKLPITLYYLLSLHIYWRQKKGPNHLHDLIMNSFGNCIPQNFLLIYFKIENLTICNCHKNVSLKKIINLDAGISG